MAKRSKKKPTADQIVKQVLGYESLRPGQDAAIQSLLERKDTLAIMPTGSGKSAIYQVAATQLSGATVVISPLLALQMDQVGSIDQQDIGDAAVLNSTLGTQERKEALENFESGKLEFLFLSPEQFNHPEALERLRSTKPSLFVVDEAHCISEWGHDFRPDYLRLGSVIEALGHPTVLAITATASPPVRQEIIERLEMRDPRVIVSGFDRPNLWLDVQRFEQEDEKQEALFNLLKQEQKPGIVYVATRKCAEKLAEALQQVGIRAIAYHAGMKKQERKKAQIDFMDDKVEVMVATTAFGMGIDKPNVRFVIHYNISDSVDSYYQEMGRAGRDGELAKAILLYSPADLKLRNFFASGGKLDAEQIKAVIACLLRTKKSVEQKAIAEKTDLSKTKVKVILNHLSGLELLKLLPDGSALLTGEFQDLEAIAQQVLQAQERKTKIERSRIEMMRNYAELHDCRRKYLLNYFGEQRQENCDFCDNCKTGAIARDTELKPYDLNSRVIHKIWGEGLVMRYEENKIVVLFDQVGYKTIDVVTALLQHLLKPVAA